MRERSLRKDATWAFSVLERGAGGEGLYGCSFDGQNCGGLWYLYRDMIFQRMWRGTKVLNVRETAVSVEVHC